MDDYSMYVPKVHYELIPIKNLVSNQEYQRAYCDTPRALNFSQWSGFE